MNARLCFLILLFIAFIVQGCVKSEAFEVMSSVKYEKPTHIHINKIAYLYWKQGRVIASTDYASAPVAIDLGTLVAGIVYAARENVKDRTMPAKDRYAFSKASQSVFMTSLYKILNRHKVFKQVILIHHLPKTIKRNAIVLSVHFKQTRVEDVDGGKRVILLATIAILDSNNIIRHSKNILVSSSVSNKLFSRHSFAEHQAEASKKLIEKIFRELNKWANKNSNKK